MVPNLGVRMITAVDCTIIRFKNEKIIPKFFLYYSLTDSYYKSISQYLTGASRRRISRSNLAKIEIPIPPIKEQEKIVAEIETKQEAIRHAKEIIKNLEREREHILVKYLQS